MPDAVLDDNRRVSSGGVQASTQNLPVLPVTAPPPSASSFVYPVRTLLTGVQPKQLGPRPSLSPSTSASPFSSESQRDYFQSFESLTQSSSVTSSEPAPSLPDSGEARSPKIDDPTPRGAIQPNTSTAGPIPLAHPSGSSLSAAHKDGLPPRSISAMLSEAEPPPSETSSIVLLPPVRPPSLVTGTGSVAHPPSQISNSSVNAIEAMDEPSEEARDAQFASEQREHQREEDAIERERLLVTTRFEHAEDADGHHVLLGREGTITHCEDEPIRIPGAVQGFGVLIAVREEDNTGNFLVRQVSENAVEILGLSPKYLFGLECLTDALPEDQADVLWENLRFLGDLTPDASDPNDCAPQVFLLSGYGEPGSALPDDTADELGRRRWTCWCAVHRPPQDAQGEPPLLTLEFELEFDHINPLYPVPSSTTNSSGGSSRSEDTVESTSLSTDSGDSSGSRETGSTASGSTQIADHSASNSSSSASAYATDSTALVTQQAMFVGDTPKSGLDGDEGWNPSPEDVLESTTSYSKPLRELERMRAAGADTNIRYGLGVRRATVASSSNGPSGQSSPVTTTSRIERRRQKSDRMAVGPTASVDIFTVLGQANDQLSAAQDLEMFLKVVVGLIKDLTQFHRVLVYQFDEAWNGQTVAELVDWSKTHDLYKGLHFPASDIPKQARDLYLINRVRLLYSTSQQTARLVCKSDSDLETPLDMTHSFLRAMSPIHIKYLGNMGVRASMSISIIAFGKLWGLVACHSYGDAGMRVSFPMRHMLRLLSDSISRNIERLSYTQRLNSRKLVSTMPSDENPAGYIISNAEDLLSLFDADFGVLVVGDGAKIMGENVRGQETLILAEYLRLKQFPYMQASKCLRDDYPDLRLPAGPEVVAGMLYVPLSRNGKDFIAFLRQGQLRHVHWAGKPFKNQNQDEGAATLEPRISFKMWSQTIVGKSRAWTDEQLETAAVLALVYGKFIEVWRQKETALQASQLTSLLLSNASHEVRTPLNQIINYLELALNGPLDDETRENLTRSHIASKSLLFTINDLLDLTRLESGQETSFNEPFDLQATITDAARLYQNEATRRGLTFSTDTVTSPKMVWGDSKKIRTVVANLTANAVKYTDKGGITVQCHAFNETGHRADGQVAVEIVVEDTGRGIPAEKLNSIFQQFENVQQQESSGHGLGLGLAVVARIVEQLGGQLRVDSELGRGSRFSFLMPFVLYEPGQSYEQVRSEISSSAISSIDSASVSTSSVDAPSTRSSGSFRSRSGHSEVESLVQALATPFSTSTRHKLRSDKGKQRATGGPSDGARDGEYPVTDSYFPIRSVKLDNVAIEPRPPSVSSASSAEKTGRHRPSVLRLATRRKRPVGPAPNKLRILVVDDDPINRKLLTTRLGRDGHSVSQCADGVEAVELIRVDRGFDCVLMDIQMPMLDGFRATKRIREIERDAPTPLGEEPRFSFALNGRIPVFAVSASLLERQREEMMDFGMDGWILKPIDYKRMNVILQGILDNKQRMSDMYSPGCSWEAGGWLCPPLSPASESSVPSSDVSNMASPNPNLSPAPAQISPAGSTRQRKSPLAKSGSVSPPPLSPS